MTGSTRNAYGSLQRLQWDFEKDLSKLRALVAASLPVQSMDNLSCDFNALLYDFRKNAKELRADLDLLTERAEVDALRAALTAIAGDGCETYTAYPEAWKPAPHGQCQRNERTVYRDPRGSYISTCTACFAAAALDLLTDPGSEQ